MYTRSLGANDKPIEQLKASRPISLKKSKRPGGDMAKMLADSAWVCYEQGKLADAADLLTQALTIREKQLGVMHRKLLPLLNGLGLVYTELGDYGRGWQAFVRALDIAEKRPRASKMREIEILSSFALMLRQAGWNDEAVQVEEMLEGARQQENRIPAAMQLARHITSSIRIDAVRLEELKYESQQADQNKIDVAFPWQSVIFVVVLFGILMCIMGLMGR